MWWMWPQAINPRFPLQKFLLSGKKSSCILERFLLICIASKHICVCYDYIGMYADRNIIESCSLSQAYHVTTAVDQPLKFLRGEKYESDGNYDYLRSREGPVRQQ